MSATTQRERLSSAEDAILRSPLAAHGGAAVIRLLDDAAVTGLANEAFVCHSDAIVQEVCCPGDEFERRGDPDRWLESASGGPLLQGFYNSAMVGDTIAGLTGVHWRTAGGLGTFSYYRRAGHHLGLHRDLELCDLAVITCVYDNVRDRTSSGTLCLYPSRTGETLEAIRADDRGGVHVRLAPGQSLVLLGGVIAHRLLPMKPGHTRIVAPLCFQAAG
ncbi:MAG: hypothetical protein ACRDJB_10830 [Actinomycetota bacterium]